MDGAFYHDTLTPFLVLDVPAVTLSTTAKALYPAAQFPAWGSGYFNKFPGKRLWIHLFGRITTVLTPGNGSFDVYFGTGADANGVILASSGALALTASQTNLSWEADIYVHCRTLTVAAGTGTLFCTGRTAFNVGVLASTLQPMLIPASAPVASAAVDLSAANIVSVQFKRSGSTVETMQIHEMTVSPMN